MRDEAAVAGGAGVAAELVILFEEMLVNVSRRRRLADLRLAALPTPERRL